MPLEIGHQLQRAAPDRIVQPRHRPEERVHLQETVVHRHAGLVHDDLAERIALVYRVEELAQPRLALRDPRRRLAFLGDVAEEDDQPAALARMRLGAETTAERRLHALSFGAPTDKHRLLAGAPDRPASEARHRLPQRPPGEVVSEAEREGRAAVDEADEPDGVEHDHALAGRLQHGGELPLPGFGGARCGRAARERRGHGGAKATDQHGGKAEEQRVAQQPRPEMRQRHRARQRRRGEDLASLPGHPPGDEKPGAVVARRREASLPHAAPRGGAENGLGRRDGAGLPAGRVAALRQWEEHQRRAIGDAEQPDPTAGPKCEAGLEALELVGMHRGLDDAEEDAADAADRAVEAEGPDAADLAPAQGHQPDIGPAAEPRDEGPAAEADVRWIRVQAIGEQLAIWPQHPDRADLRRVAEQAGEFRVAGAAIEGGPLVPDRLGHTVGDQAGRSEAALRVLSRAEGRAVRGDPAILQSRIVVAPGHAGEAATQEQQHGNEQRGQTAPRRASGRPSRGAGRSLDTRRRQAAGEGPGVRHFSVSTGAGRAGTPQGERSREKSCMARRGEAMQTAIALDGRRWRRLWRTIFPTPAAARRRAGAIATCRKPGGPLFEAVDRREEGAASDPCGICPKPERAAA